MDKKKLPPETCVKWPYRSCGGGCKGMTCCTCKEKEKDCAQMCNRPGEMPVEYHEEGYPIPPPGSYKEACKKHKASTIRAKSEDDEETPEKDSHDEKDAEGQEEGGLILVSPEAFKQAQALVSCSELMENKAKGIIEIGFEKYVGLSASYGLKESENQVNIAQIRPAHDWSDPTFTYNELSFGKKYSRIGHLISIKKIAYVICGPIITLMSAKPVENTLPESVVIHVRYYGGTHIAKAQGMKVSASSTSDYVFAAEACAAKVYGKDKFELIKDKSHADTWIAKPIKEKENKMTEKKKTPPMPPSTKMLKISEISMEGTQSRIQTDTKTLIAYTEDLLAGAKFPPVVVFDDGSKKHLADGFHRVSTYRTAKKEEILCEIHKGTVIDAFDYGCRANDRHGLKATREDKHYRIKKALEYHPDSSSREIARICGVSDKTVETIRNEVRNSAPDQTGQVVTVTTSTQPPQPQTRVGKDGKKYPPPPPNRTSKDTMKVEKTLTAIDAPCGEESPGCCQCENEECEIREAKFGDAVNCGAKKACSAECPRYKKPESFCESVAGKVLPKEDRDKIGRKIPESLKVIWSRRDEALGILSELSSVRAAVQRAEENKDKLYAEVNFSNVRANLDQAYAALKVAIPYAVCPYCQGIGCKACAMRGMVSKYRWEKTCAQEFKDAVIKGVKKELGDKYNEVAGLSDEGV